MPRLYKALVRPHLKYGIIIWDPRYRVDKLEVENVQRCATKLVAHIKEDRYESRLKALKLPSLELRHKHGDMIHVLKILNGINRIEPELLFRVAEEHGTIGHKDKMFLMQNRLELRRNTFSQHFVQDWNKLSEATVSATTINMFKTRLDNEWQAMKCIEP